MVCIRFNIIYKKVQKKVKKWIDNFKKTSKISIKLFGDEKQ